MALENVSPFNVSSLSTYSACEGPLAPERSTEDAVDAVPVFVAVPLTPPHSPAPAAPARSNSRSQPVTRVPLWVNVTGGVVTAAVTTGLYVGCLAGILISKSERGFNACMQATCQKAFGVASGADYDACVNQLSYTGFVGGDNYLNIHGNTVFFSDVPCLNTPYNLADGALFGSIFGGLFLLGIGGALGAWGADALYKATHRRNRLVN